MLLIKEYETSAPNGVERPAVVTTQAKELASMTMINVLPIIVLTPTSSLPLGLTWVAVNE